ncbi:MULTISPECIES: DUF6119 family protein [unclassified Mesorhizobium]|uniref:DUF6119 family protein n=1 Tax=unclassified Mesorhizobium TaxID=325217 RepID=UPI0003CDEC67|nr:MULTISPECIES: DUF6119 family protein [unclassified Mesorhizobium]ESX29455.1 hypothetical protein X765_13680 [Mesorhizobium sp. LSHC440B00]ESX37774.1 hypothetical protein X763_13255 [Mesorhizobium sp. LSHC432A00]ESX43263.1 hypothetical protein X764_07460 [Mesorhizobium sp. LSHC440A00]WJI57298.1 TIGR04141 family sporadically distributed protein [Mesorhizobium sp. C432A]
MEGTGVELAQITFFLAKEGVTMGSIIDEEADLAGEKAVQSFDFGVEDAACRFIYFEAMSVRKNPPWLDFINEQLGDAPITFGTTSLSPNGLLLISIDERVFAAVFGRSATGCLNRKMLEPDFGIKTAMNMCGNQEIRQTRSQSNTITPTHIDRQAAKPSDSFVFGLSEAEDLRYISAHIKGSRNTTLQGRDSLTVKVIGEDKLSWGKIIAQCQEFFERFGARDYIALFPNYRNFQPASDEDSAILDAVLVAALRAKDYGKVELCIPEFLSEEDYSFSYSNKAKLENTIYSFLEPKQIEKVFKTPEAITVEHLQNKRIYAYSAAEDRVLGYRHWSIYDCLVYEHELDGRYFILNDGRWVQVDPDFYNSIIEFIANRVQEEAPEDWYLNIDISDDATKTNSEAIFNAQIVELRPTCVLFDRAKLQIGVGRKDKEFCDVLDLQDNGVVRIINAKQYKDASSINYLFSQAKFYCEAFLNDETFLGEIREFIEQGPSPQRAAYLDYIKPEIENNHGADYVLCLWLLYDKSKAAPAKGGIPLIAQYELKLMHDHLRKVCKFQNIIIRFIPVKTTRYTQSRKNKKTA